MDPGRLQAVRRAAARWQDQLVDVSGRNRLLNFRDLKVGTLDLTPGPESPIKAPILDGLLQGRVVHLSELIEGAAPQSTRVLPKGGNAVQQVTLLGDPAHVVDARRRLSNIYRRAQEYSDERGINTLFAGVGLATWKVEGGSDPNAPVILVPINVIPVDAARLNFRIEVSGDLHLNPVLAHVFQSQFGLAQLEEDEEMPLQPFSSLLRVLRELESRWSSVPRLTINPRMVLGNFSYTNMPMVEDLKNNLEAFARNDFVASIAGVEEARQALAENIHDPSPSQPDYDPPESEFLVLDADSSQHRAINRANAGQTLVIWGPPGTGKSQTIANLIATLIAAGKKVLFVAEKRAAIDMVVSRLNGKGLADLVMDLHGGVKSKSEFAQSIDDSIRGIQSIAKPDYSGLYDELSRVRADLIEHRDAIHKPRLPWNVSAYEVVSRLVAAPSTLRSLPQIPLDKARSLNRQDLNRLLGDVKQWVELEGPALHSYYKEWAQSAIDTHEEAQKVFHLASDLATTTLPDARAVLLESLEGTYVPLLETVSGWELQLQWLLDVEELMERTSPRIYNLNHTSIIVGLEPASRWWQRPVASLSHKYRDAKRAARAALKDGVKLSDAELLFAVAEAQNHLRSRPFSYDGIPPLPRNLSTIHDMVARLTRDLKHLEQALRCWDLLTTPHYELEETLRRLASQHDVVARLPSIRKLERSFAAAGINRIIDSVDMAIPPESAALAVEQAWLGVAWEEMLFSDRMLSGFTQSTLSSRQERFVTLDHKHLDIVPERIKRLVAENAIEEMNAHTGEIALLRRQAVIKRRHLPVRRLFPQARHVLTAIRPCWTMSPLLVAETLPADPDLFDVVIFDEASQIPPAEAIGSIARAHQAVIAGDERQLPPTSFFQKQEDDDLQLEDGDMEEEAQEPALTEDIESILGVAKASPIREELLEWHYRSRDGRLIAFSNNNIYGESLTAFPGTATASPILHHLVPFRPIPTKSTRSNPDEVNMVVDMIVEHAQEHPDETLGVITFGIHHAENIDNALRIRLRDTDSKHLEGFFSEDPAERFFIKNIERVQGDERDVIILSVGYHKDGDGRLRYRFGPLAQEGGERRLNVAITRARSRIHVVSSFSHHDMEPGRSSARGVELLRQYLEFAASGGNELSASVANEPLNAFELDVKNRLEAKGIPLTPQYGVSGYRIDFACAHPNQHGRMVLAIETDGATYHSTPTARDRDRLRQEVLENKGWRFHRIWSTEWFRNRDKETERAMGAWKQAVELADRGLATDSTTPRRAESKANSDLGESRVPDRGPKPRIRPGMGISYYSVRQLMDLAKWITSDTFLRTDEDLMAEMRRELGFQRRGTRIDAALRETISEMRRRKLIA